MSETKKKKRRAYLDSFQKNEAGKYDYTGNNYFFEGTDDELRCSLMKLWGLCVVLMGSLIAAGCISVPGMDNCFYVLLPYVAALMAGVSVFWALCRMTSGKNPLKEYVYEASVVKLPERAVMTVFLAVVTLIGEVIYICMHGMEGKTAGFCVFMLLESAAAGAVLVMRREIQHMNWIKHKSIQQNVCSGIKNTKTYRDN
ncbi:MAG: hypothetical protein ACI4D3_00010 [Lachnospiraceae bacterium]